MSPSRGPVLDWQWKTDPVMPPRRTGKVLRVSHGSLFAWRLVSREDAAAVAGSLWRATPIQASVEAYPVDRVASASWDELREDVEAAAVRLRSVDRDCAGVALAETTPTKLAMTIETAARQLADEVAGTIKVLRAPDAR